jgi:RNA polymerase sigma-70 factor (ECF subfamily)
MDRLRHPAPANRNAEPIAEQIAALQPRLLHFALSLTRDQDRASDLAQETVARALGSVWRFTPGTNLRAWLFTILRNLHLNRQRAANGHAQIVSLDNFAAELATDGPTDPVCQQALVHADLERVREAFRRLPPVFAVPLHLTAVEGLSYAEAAKIVDVPIGTVMSRIHRGRRLLLALLTEGAP